jgi:predicted enzyme related to lactoylglutathione lyase
MLYLDCTGILDEAAERVVAAGGRLLQPVAEIGGGFGRSAKIQDTEGNHISLHSR